MHLFWAILLWLFWAFVFLLCTALVALVLLLALPATVTVEYRPHAVVVKLRVLFLALWIKRELESGVSTKTLQVLMFSFALDPSHKRPKRKNDKKETSAQASDAQNTHKFPSLDEIVPVASRVSGAMRRALKGVWVSGIILIWPVHKEDAAQTAIGVGKTNAYFGGLFATIENLVHLKFQSVKILPDFTNAYAGKRYFYCKIGTTPFILLTAIVYFFIQKEKEKIG